MCVHNSPNPSLDETKSVHERTLTAPVPYKCVAVCLSSVRPPACLSCRQSALTLMLWNAIALECAA